MQQFQVLASPDVQSIKEQATHSLETHPKSLERDPLLDSTEHIPQDLICDYTNNVDNDNTPVEESTTSEHEPAVVSAEPESMDFATSPARAPLSQRRQAQELSVVTDRMVSPSPSLSTPLRTYRMPSSLRGSFSETTSARSPTTVIPPDFSLKRPAGRRHSTIIIAAQRLEADARRKEIPASKATASAIDKRAFGFEPIFGEWERRAKADKPIHTSRRTIY